MRALFDVTHPALVHLFAPAAEALEAGGHDVTVAAREKDVTTDLLDAAGVPYAVVSHAGAGRSLGSENFSNERSVSFDLPAESIRTWS